MFYCIQYTNFHHTLLLCFNCEHIFPTKYLQTFTALRITIWWIFEAIFFTPLTHSCVISMSCYWHTYLTTNHKGRSTTVFCHIREIHSIGDRHLGKDHIWWSADIAYYFYVCAVSKSLLIPATNGSSSISAKSPSIALFQNKQSVKYVEYRGYVVCT